VKVVQATLDQVAKTAASEEYLGSAVYHRLAESHRLRKREHARKLAAVFEQLSRTERSHYEFWRGYSAERTEPRVSRWKFYGIVVMEAVLGATFAIRFLEKHERTRLERYGPIEKLIPEASKPAFEQILKEEQEHQATLASQIDSTVLKYMSFVVLGLADAIVEISGIHAGSLGIYNSTVLTGLAGIVAGAAASISMASAAFAQAKQGFQGSPKVSAAITGVSYFVTAVFLAAPYFLIHSAAEAMLTSLAVAAAVLAFTSYYNSIISGARFLRDFMELAGTMLGATLALLILGAAIRAYFGITI
jgi:VIT1/CCC1 family predicted Fe2+/Mn2+ transporter